ncbi:hypothetical protein [Embleya scabrispora]|uniref:hypothetical protein n=1 Tax=Embleya scabrispora TaxID=159449 RepID=UPI002AA2AA05|nr:hypothetical protein [Embleya scabrispora]
MALPVHAGHGVGHELLPPLMESGTYAIDPAPFGPPWRPWDEVGPAQAAARGLFAPTHTVCFGTPGTVVVRPGDTRNTALIPDRCEGSCYGVDGRAGPNLACTGCGRPVATRIDDCGAWQEVRFAPQAVRLLAGDEREPWPLDWATLANERSAIEPIEPQGWWNPRWEAAVAVALAHVVAASAGGPVTVPDGLLTETFGRSLDILLPPGPPAKRLIPAGPGLPDHDDDADIVLVPGHPQTGEAWQSPAPVAAVPLAAEVWMYLAFHQDRHDRRHQCDRLPIPASGGMPEGVLRDDPLPRHPWSRFRPAGPLFLRTLVGLPAVRRPWLREIHDRVRTDPYAFPF